MMTKDEFTHGSLFPLGANMQTSQAQIDEWITRVKAWV